MRLRGRGPRKVFPFRYAVDAHLSAPARLPKTADGSYFALSSVAREEWMNKLITLPSRGLRKRRFLVAGGAFQVDLGAAQYAGDLSYSQYRDFCCQSVINLNITSRTYANERGTST